MVNIAEKVVNKVNDTRKLYQSLSEQFSSLPEYKNNPDIFMDLNDLIIRR